ncbi:MAG: primosomal protein [Leptolyngbyaceae cyanobacterium CRU_2_3]|nr:primosomal protein [Leptolyngbyaceae cyanobacterium CRU_2_3]
MVRPAEQIEREIVQLDQATATLAQEFYNTYEQYLTALGTAVRQQFILASYHLCTHGYPEHFLQLSLRQRQELQRSLRQLAKQTQSRLIEQLQPIQASEESTLADQFSEDSSEEFVEASGEDEGDPETEGAKDQPVAEDIKNKPEQGEDAPEDATEEEGEDIGNDATEDALRSPEPPSSDAFPILINFSQLRANPDSANTSAQPGDPLSPMTLAQWQKHLEERVVEQLQTLSHTANRLFQQSNMLSKLLPEPVLEVASKADLTSETTASPPNLLSLLIESESEETTMTEVTTIHLRLSEIEFSDSTVAVWRSKVRTLMAQLNKLGREYQKRQRERSIAQAEAAWRSIWYEE